MRSITEVVQNLLKPYIDRKIAPLQGYGSSQVYTAGSDLDTYKDTGIWMVWVDNQVSTSYHFPPMAESAGILVVTSTYNNAYKYIQQEYIERSNGRRHVRTWDNNINTWSNWHIDSYDDTRHAITTTDTEINVDASYSYWMIRNGFCFAQMRVNISDTSQHSINIGLPKSSFGDYLYFRSENGDGSCRVSQNGSIRFQSDTAGNWLVFIISYPCSE